LHIPTLGLLWLIGETMHPTTKHLRQAYVPYIGKDFLEGQSNVPDAYGNRYEFFASGYCVYARVWEGDKPMRADSLRQFIGGVAYALAERGEPLAPRPAEDILTGVQHYIWGAVEQKTRAAQGV
jgi:hypothetical protein